MSMKILQRIQQCSFLTVLLTIVYRRETKTIRQRRDWEAGTRLIVEETPEGVLLKRAPSFLQTRPDEVFGMLPFGGEPKTPEDMEAGVLAEARRRHDRD